MIRILSVLMFNLSWFVAPHRPLAGGDTKSTLVRYDGVTTPIGFHMVMSDARNMCHPLVRIEFGPFI